MKVVFLYPKLSSRKSIYKEYPVGLGILATILKKNNVDVKIIDQQIENISDNELIKNIEKFNPNIVGFSLITPTYYRGVSLLKKLKSKFPEKYYIAGGIHVSLFPQEAINDGFDVAVIGAADNIIYKIVCYIGTSKIQLIPNIVYRSNGSIKYTKLCTNQINISTVINRSLYNISLYSHHSVCATVGCPFSCKFCYNYSSIISDGKVLIKPIDLLVSEVGMLVNDYGAKDIFFTDDVFLYKKNNIFKFCEYLIRQNIKINFYVQLRADIISKDLVLALKKAGCKRIYIGVESGSQILLENSNKHLKISDIVTAIEICKKYQMRVKTGWIYGIPYGGIEENLKTVELILQTRPNDVSIHRLIPFPGTEYYNKHNEYGIIIDNEEKRWKSFRFDGIDSSIRYTYLPYKELQELLQITQTKLENAGYKKPQERNSLYTYTMPNLDRHIDLLHGGCNE